MKLLTTFLPGELRLERGTAGDYRALEAHHYRRGRPASWAQIWTIRSVPPPGRSRHGPRVAAVAVVSYPIPNCLPRRRALGLVCSPAEELAFANEHIRTISRVIVHPQFRALGLSSILVSWICEHCDTRYVEAMAAMGRAHPFFERAGMKQYEPTQKNGAVYYLFDRKTWRRRAPGAGR
jgi:GNAT superfamily N-acetyltransferase